MQTVVIGLIPGAAARSLSVCVKLINESFTPDHVISLILVALYSYV